MVSVAVWPGVTVVVPVIFMAGALVSMMVAWAEPGVPT